MFLHELADFFVRNPLIKDVLALTASFSALAVSLYNARRAQKVQRSVDLLLVKDRLSQCLKLIIDTQTLRIAQEKKFNQLRTKARVKQLTLSMEGHLQVETEIIQRIAKDWIPKINGHVERDEAIEIQLRNMIEQDALSPELVQRVGSLAGNVAVRYSEALRYGALYDNCIALAEDLLSVTK